MVTPKMFDVFWNWFGKTMQKLRYQRHILPLWQSGYDEHTEKLAFVRLHSFVALSMTML